MPARKIIAVTGATGRQGGSVAKYLLKDGTFAVRALTRKPDSAAAKALAAQGAEVVQTDLSDRASISKAFEGVYGVFAVTNFWEPGVAAAGEIAQGKALVDASKAAGVKHFIWSTLDRSDAKPTHWESKADVDDYLKASALPRTSLYTTFYLESYETSLPMKKQPDGSYEFPLLLPTDSKFGLFAVGDTGAYALAAFKHPEEWLGKDLRLMNEALSPREISKILSEVSGKTVTAPEITPEVYETLKGNPLPAEYHDNFSALYQHNKPPSRDPALCRKLNPEMKTFREYAQANIDKILR